MSKRMHTTIPMAVACGASAGLVMHAPGRSQARIARRTVQEAAP